MHRFTGRGNALVEAAFVWLSEGVSVVPAQPRSKEVWYRWRKWERTIPPEEMIYQWFANGIMNLAVVCGSGGLLVLDFDQLEAFKVWKAAAGAVATTYTETSGRGIHLFYKVDQPATRRFAQGVETLGLGHLCNVAPSIHPNGNFYQVLGDPLAPIKKVETTEFFNLVSEIFGVERRQVARRELLEGAAIQSIPQRNDVIGRIKTQLPLFPYVSRFVDLNPCGGGGRYLQGLCPFHDDHHPSLIVDLVSQKWLCHSPSCPGHLGGDVINFYALINNLSVYAAIRQLAGEVLPR